MRSFKAISFWFYFHYFTFTNLVSIFFCFSQLGGPVPVASHTNKLCHVSMSQYLLCTLVIKFYQRYLRSYTTFMPVGQYMTVCE